jgi:hypothetical protein
MTGENGYTADADAEFRRSGHLPRVMRDGAPHATVTDVVGRPPPHGAPRTIRGGSRD